jgi:DNA replication protein DnaC
METEKRMGKVMHISQLLPEQLKVPVSLNDVELSQEEIDRAIELAKLEKHVRLESDRRKALAIQQQAETLRPWSPKELWEHARQRGSIAIRERTGDLNAEFKATKEQIPVVRALALYFTGNSEFDALDTSQYNSTGLEFSLQKGIWLWGNPGVGKTLIMSMFSKNKRLCYRMLQCPKIVASYNLDGYDAIKQYARVWPEPIGASNFMQDKIGICYNDLGTEPMHAKNYGNAINVMETLFLETYENHVPFFHRHVTTNLTLDQVKEHYGVRVQDRIKECFNVIDLKGASLRR